MLSLGQLAALFFLGVRGALFAIFVSLHALLPGRAKGFRTNAERA